MLLIVSDLDGTLLDPVTYALGPAEAVVARMRRSRIPLVACSSKTRAEIESLLSRLGLDEPFICENGGAIYVPGTPPAAGEANGGRLRIELGRPYEEVVAILREVAADQDVRIRGFSDMSVAEISRDCGLSPLQAQLAKLREFDEPFRLLETDPGISSRFLRALHRRGLRTVEGGRYFHATGETDKGMAVDVLRARYGTDGTPVLVGLGDAPNDISLLRAVDIPVIVRREDSAASSRLLRKVPTARLTERLGPAGWAEAVSEVLDQWESGGLRQWSEVGRS